MLKQFAQKIEDMRRLIDNSRSASSVMSSGSSSVMSSERSESRHLFLLAVSGGMDSMCMADLFLQTFGADAFAIAHCNFSLRGEESDGDQALVCEWAQNNDIKLFTKRFDTVSYAREKGISIEMAARDLRYGWFAQLCHEYGYGALVVAHNANDNAETLMLNLLRGTGLNGLHGMAEISCVSDADDILLLRPLLDFTRKQIEGYVLAHRVPYRHDSSNFGTDYKRNKIRNEVFPVFERINPSVVRTLNREIGYFTEAGSIVDEWCRTQLPSVLFKSPAGPSAGTSFSTSSSVMSIEHRESRHLSIDIPALLAIPQWRYLLYYILSPYGFNHQLLASIESLLLSSRTLSGKRFESETHVLYTERDHLVLTEKTDVSEHESSAYECDNDVMVVRGAGIYNFNGRRFQVEVMERTEELQLKQPAGTLLLDAEMLRFPFVCRRWRQGDWFVPFGMRGKKKVSDLFADLKFTGADKSSAVIIVDTQTPDLAEQQHIAALLGLRIDDRYKVTPSTRTLLRVTVL